MPNAPAEERSFLNSESGKRIELVSTLGEGGQGKVYRVGGDDQLLAKVYKEQEGKVDRVARLKALRALDRDRLHQVAAWPLETLEDDKGETVGFLMENLKGWAPLHKVYQIKSRLTLLPEADFSFLVRIARNLATCIHYLHDAGLVVGDLNESNVLVSGNAMVKVIDSDSIQVEAEGKLYTCDVGRPELIAPELQGHSLASRKRLPEEDRFSLAVLLFQTLAFGRHPYAGRPKGSEEISLETAIEHRLYVYQKGGNRRLEAPPGLRLEFLSEEVKGLFERAFCGEPSDRPTAMEWIVALEKMEEALEPCPQTVSHRSIPSTECPWCRLEREWRIVLFGAERKIARVSNDFDPSDIWGQIESLAVPQTYELPPPLTVESVEPSTDVLRKLQGKFLLFGVLVVFALCMGAALLAVRQMLLGGGALAAVFGGALVAVLGTVIVQRRALKKARQDFEPVFEEYRQLKAEWERRAATEIFEEKRREIREAIQRIDAIDEYRESRYQAELRQLYQYELERFLRKYSITVADVGTASKSLLSRLNDNGVKSAADLDETDLVEVHRVTGPVMKDLMAWRHSLEETFWATSPYRLSAAHMQQIDRDIANQMEAYRRQVLRGRKDLNELSEDLIDRQRYLGPQIHEAHFKATEAAKAYKALLLANNSTIPTWE